ncbi:MAG TPA: histidine kinase, partial [Spirochaetota bacterium]|nr:histidine kinase [Spirochaetota bacterium]
FKHAFPDNRKGNIFIKLVILENSEIKIEYSDDGVGLNPNFDNKKVGTFGFGLLDAIVENQLQGKIEFKNEKGFNCIIIFKKNLYSKRVENG